MADTSWIKKKERSNKWITKKEKPKSWITKKEKPKDWITKKKNWITKKPPNADLRKKLTDALAGGVKGKPHSSPSGRAASAGRTIKRLAESRPAEMAPASPRKALKEGGDVTRFRSSGPEGKPHSTKEGRSAEAQRAYMRKHGPKKTRRKTLSVTDKYKEIREKNKFKKDYEAGFKPFRTSKQHGGRTRLLEELGRVEAEPSNRNRRAEISRVHGELNRGYKSGGAVLKGKKVGIQIK